MRRAAWNGNPKRFNQARRPKYLFSGLTKCAECGGGYVMYWRDRLACFGARSRGTCTNRLGENDAWLVATADSLNAGVIGADRAAFERLGARYLRFQ